MPDDEVVDPRPWSLDDVSDEALMDRLKKIGFSGPAPAPAAPARSDDGVTQKILSALERLGEKNAAPATPPAAPAEPVVQQIVEKVHSWFLDD